MNSWTINSHSWEDNMEESNQSRLDEFLDRWLTPERLELLLSDEYRAELIRQLNDSYASSIWNILSIWNNEKLEKQRDNIVDLIRFVSLYKSLLSDIDNLKQLKDSKIIELEKKDEEIVELKVAKHNLSEDVSKLQKIIEEQSEWYELFKSEYERTINELTRQLESEKQIVSDLMEEDLVTKINSKKLQDSFRKKLKEKKIIWLEEFLESKDWEKLLKKRVLEQTSGYKKEINRLKKKLDKLAQRVVDLEDTNTLYKILNWQLNADFEKLSQFTADLMTSSPTNDDVRKLQEKINSLIVEKSDLVLQLAKWEEKIEERVEWVEKTVEQMKLEMEEMKRKHELELKAKDEEIERIKAANNIWVSPHIIKKAHEAYSENK